MTSEEVRARCIFQGRVQGVFFRANTVEFAHRLGVKGWVKNLPDGHVEAVFEGKKESVEEVIRMCKEEQPHGKVSSADIAWEEAEGGFDGFSVRY